MTKIVMSGKANHIELTNRIKEKISKSGSSCMLITESYDSFGDINIVLLIFEKYYYRNKGRVSLTIQIINYNDSNKITIIGAGGGNIAEPIIYSAKDEFAKIIIDYLITIGFNILEEYN